MYRKVFITLLMIYMGLGAQAGNTIDDYREFYQDLGDTTLNPEALRLALMGFENLKDSIDLHESIISIVDFSQPSHSKRYYVIDVHQRKILYREYVAHGKNSGNIWARSFSNTPHSHQSSLGFYITAETYFGKHGLSLRIDGLEQNINHLARKRAIVMHAATYAEESFIKRFGRLGRSFGCPALPSENFPAIINQIKSGTLLFVYSGDKNYKDNSTIITR